MSPDTGRNSKSRHRPTSASSHKASSRSLAKQMSTQQDRSPGSPRSEHALSISSFDSAFKKRTNPSRDLLRRQGETISGLFCIISIYSYANGLVIEAECEELGGTLETSTRSFIVSEHDSPESIDSLCQAIIDNLEIRDGKLYYPDQDVIEEEEFVYSVEHTISGKKYDVQITERSDGLMISAKSKKTGHVLYCPVLRQKQLKRNEKTQKKLKKMLKRLKVEQLFGEKTLIISGKDKVTAVVEGSDEESKISSDEKVMEGSVEESKISSDETTFEDSPRFDLGGDQKFAYFRFEQDPAK